ncbi:hypothetical protein [Streptomyces sp. NPDC002215]|uniref:hypothetical protein n=1 Tax=Streptomyces sp. NPDC002215 TaxID=3154412 RepID=UPI00332A5DB2
MGLLFDAPRPAVLALFADLVPEQARGRRTHASTGCPVLAWEVAGAVGTARADNDITALFHVAATSDLAFATTVLNCKIGAGPPVKTHHRRAASAATGYRDLLHDGRFLALCGLTLLYLCSYQQARPRRPTLRTWTSRPLVRDPLPG